MDVVWFGVQIGFGLAIAGVVIACLPAFAWAGWWLLRGVGLVLWALGRVVYAPIEALLAAITRLERAMGRPGADKPRDRASEADVDGPL